MPNTKKARCQNGYVENVTGFVRSLMKIAHDYSLALKKTVKKTEKMCRKQSTD